MELAVVLLKKFNRKSSEKCIYVTYVINTYNRFIVKVKVEVDSMLKVLSATQPNFILCLQPHNMSGLSELFRRNPAPALDQKLLRDQV